MKIEKNWKFDTINWKFFNFKDSQYIEVEEILWSNRNALKLKLTWTREQFITCWASLNLITSW